MEWRDKGFIIAVRRHGERDAIIDTLTQTHGRHAGYVHGGGVSRRLRGILTRGNLVHLVWRARLAELLGSFHAELDTAHTARLMDDAVALNALDALCALARCLPDRLPMPKVFFHFSALLDALSQPDLWPASYARFEFMLLAELGFGLDLDRARGAGMAFVSPEGVVAAAESLSRQEAKLKGLAYLPLFLIHEEKASPPHPSREDIIAALRLAGWFLHKHIYQPRGQKLPAARQKLVKKLMA